MDKLNMLIQERGEIARRIADNLLNVNKDIDNKYVIRYWELVKEINKLRECAE